MQGTTHDKFRPTPWPGGTIPIPKVHRTPATVLQEFPFDDLVIEYDVAGREQSSSELPDDFVLQEVFAFDVDDAEALADFTSRWGWLTHFGDQRLRSLPPGTYSGRHGEQQHREWIEMVSDKGYSGDFIVPVRLVALHVRFLRAMATHLQVFLSGGSLEAYQQAWVVHGHPVEPATEGMAWLWFDDAINKALTPYHVSIQSDPELFGQLTGAKPMPTLYEACALQLYNYIVEGVPFTRCANESCGKLFTKQRGRPGTVGEWNRTAGVRYCSHRCAKAQSERERRRRQRQEATGLG
jgi:hypothetical protein